VDPRAGLYDVEKIKFFILPGLELRPLGGPARYTDYVIPADNILKTRSFERIKYFPKVSITNVNKYFVFVRNNFRFKYVVVKPDTSQSVRCVLLSAGCFREE
jgi:hypothetical protein